MKDTAPPQIAEQLDALSQKYDKAVNHNDATAVAANYTEDAVFVTDAGPLYGRQAIEEWYANAFQQWHPKTYASKSDQNSPHLIGTAGHEVWSNGEWGETFQGENPTELKGYWGAVAVREGGDWKFRMLTWNLTPPAAAA